MSRERYTTLLALGLVAQWRGLSLKEKRAFVRELHAPNVTGPERLARLRALAIIESEA